MTPLARMLVPTAALALALFTSTVQAAPCAGFNDVDSADGFCKNVEWLKNRGITVGCSGTTLYCPGQVVTRAQMASFLNRLGNVLTPVDLFRSDTWSFGFPLIDVDADVVVCALTAPYQVTTYPRLAHGEGYLLGGYGSGTGNFDIQFVEQIDNGTWTPVSATRRGSTVDNALDSVTVLLPPRALDPGFLYNYGLRVTRAPGGTTLNDLSNWTCAVRVRIENRNGTSSPFDEED